MLCFKIKKELRKINLTVSDIVLKYFRDIPDNWVYESDLWFALKREGIILEYNE